ncbi:hypothetical protein [Halomonas stenophila]|uniref:Ketosteroid isomerase-like protein n=1 Tax=Halomonas stenophila TaxID=795312 RepID=A0A7W5HLF9_9GAMM|nr:hypothetical protein [Halomonas stenophila]MBB3231058.1 ketosteroid isomerase-like protein [Halomonas stenophila]
MTNRYFEDVPARGHWIRPGTDHATVGREIVGNAMREYLARNPKPTDDGQATIDAAYEAAQRRKANAWKDDDGRQLSDDAASSYRRDLPTGDSYQRTEDAIEDSYQRYMRRKVEASK